jgi:hypothetical protein
MIDRPRPPFQVSSSQQTLAEIQGLSRRAIALGLAPLLAAALRHVWEQLENDPINWGDPQRHYLKANLLQCHRAYAQLSVTYAVDEQHRVVYVRRIVPLPHTPLATD